MIIKTYGRKSWLLKLYAFADRWKIPRVWMLDFATRQWVRENKHLLED